MPTAEQNAGDVNVRYFRDSTDIYMVRHTSTSLWLAFLA